MTNRPRALFLAGALFTALAFADVAIAAHETILTASDGDSADQFGSGVALSGDLAVVAAFGGERPSGIGRGTVYVFRGGGSGWIEEQELVPSDDATWFAPVRADVSGDLVAVGAPASDAVYLYRFDGTSWLEEAKLLDPGSGNANYGEAVAVSGDVVVVGARDQSGGGRAYVYRRTGSAWNLEATLTPSAPNPSDPFDWFGSSVAIDGNVVVVGALFDDTPEGSDAGSAYVFRWNGSTWVQEGHLLGDPTTGPSDNVGESVSVSGDLIVVGAPDAFSASGRAFVYRRTGSAWAFEAQLAASDATNNAWFGREVAVSGDRIVAGSYPRNAAYVFEYGPVPFSFPWTQIEKLVPSDGGSIVFGAHVAIQDVRVLVGASGRDVPENDAGAAYLYDEAACSNGIDDDSDGFVDTADGGCTSAADPSEREPTLPCDDTVDGDGDGEAAFPDDVGCTGPGDASEREAGIVCDDEVDADGDGIAAFPQDPGCSDVLDASELDASLPCDDGADNDGDGYVDFPADPGCADGSYPREDPRCQNGLDDDARDGVDFDGGASVNGGVPIADPDPKCFGVAAYHGERIGCGLGFEIAPLLVALQLVRKRRRAAR